MLIAVDPGVRVAGVAVYEDGELSSAWLARGTGWLNTAQAVWNDLLLRYPLEILGGASLAIEVMQVYTQSKLKGDPNDLIDVSLMAGALVGTITLAYPGVHITTYRPRQWKGQVPKSIMTRRIKKKLSPDERARMELPGKDLQHNVYDAVGIGMYHERKKRRGRKSAEEDSHRAGD